MGCAASREDATDRAITQGQPSRPQAQADDHAAIPLLVALDDRLVAALRSGAIKLLLADFLRGDQGSASALPRILRRQDLEALEQSTGARVFLSPSEAVEALRANARLVAALTYGWTSPDHPDLSSAYLEAVRRYLRSPLGAHVVAIFWDFASLPQKPRSKAEDGLFGEALSVMGDTYASALGTTVVRHRTVPPRPAKHDGEVVVLVEAGGALDSAGAGPVLQEALAAHGELAASGARYEKAQARWRVRFATHAAAEAAVAALGAADGAKIAGALAVFVYYNGRPYGERGCASKRFCTHACAHTLCTPSALSLSRDAPTFAHWCVCVCLLVCVYVLPLDCACTCALAMP